MILFKRETAEGADQPILQVAAGTDTGPLYMETAKKWPLQHIFI